MVERGFARPPPTGANGNDSDQQHPSAKSDPSASNLSQTFSKCVNVSAASSAAASKNEPAQLAEIPIGDARVRAKLRFDVVTAKVVETAGKKHVVSRFICP